MRVITEFEATGYNANSTAIHIILTRANPKEERKLTINYGASIKAHIQTGQADQHIINMLTHGQGTSNVSSNEV